MFRILTVGEVATAGLAHFPPSRYRVGADVDSPHALLLGAGAGAPPELPEGVLAVARAATGAGDLPLEWLDSRGIALFHGHGAGTNAVCELVLAAMLMAARDLPAVLTGADAPVLPATASQPAQARALPPGRELAGRTLGVIGVGAVGSRVAQAAHSLGMRVLACDPRLDDGSRQLPAGALRAGSLAELYAGADFVSFHVPANAATRHLFHAGALAHLRRQAVLLNFAGPSVVCADAVLAGLAQGRIHRYLTDFPQPALAGEPRITQLPHLGEHTREAVDAAAVMVAGQLRDFLEDGNVRGALNLPALELPRLGAARLCAVSRADARASGRIAVTLGAAGWHIVQMQAAIMDGLAYAMFDLDGRPDEACIRRLAAIAGVHSVRLP